MLDKYIYVIVALLPIASLILIFQSNPYQALVDRAILGAIAALVYATLGGADVALTEALVGTMLGTTLYIVAVRSSLVMRLGVVNRQEMEYFTEFLVELRKIVNQYHLRLEIVNYDRFEALEQALINKEVHAICTQQESGDRSTTETKNEPVFNMAIRIHRLFEILQSEIITQQITLEYVISNSEEKH